MIRKLSTLVLSLMVSTFVAQAQTPPDNEIWYTTTDGNKAELWTGGDSFEENGWDFEIISHTYNNGLGIIHANGPIKAYGYEEDGDLYYELRLTGNNLITITFPKCTEYFYYTGFGSCENLRTIQCRYASSDGRCLINDGELIDFAPAGLTSYTIPNSVTSIKDEAFKGCSSLTSITIPNSVTSIGEWAFEYCSSLTSITIPDSVTEIGEYAFSGCSSLTSITIPESVTTIISSAFNGCDSIKTLSLDTNEFNADYIYLGNLEELTLGTSVKDVAEGTFAQSSKLKRLTINTEFFSGKWVDLSKIEEITIAPGITILDSNALSGFSGKLIVDNNNITWATLAGANPTEIVIGDNVQSFEHDALSECSNLTKFSGSNTTEDGCNVVVNGRLIAVIQANLTEYVVPEGVTEIGSYVFKGCTSLTSITIPDSVTTIGKYAFYGCSSLTQITLPEGITKLENGVFANCGLTSIDLPNGITTIGEYTFYECANLASVTIAPGVTSIGVGAFKDCSNLKSVIIADSVTTIGKDAFAGCNIEQIVVNAVTGNKIPYGNGLAADKVVAYTGKYASEDGLCLIKHGTLLDYLHKGTTTYAIPEGVKVISNKVFSGCSSLIEVTIPESVAEIGSQAFKGCSGISKMRIPAGTTWIGEDTFGECSSITEITFMAIIPPTISNLGISESVIIYVPKEAIKEYKTEPNWMKYSKQFKRVK